MIVAVTLKPALDVTYLVDRFTPGAAHQVRRTLRRAGGKGVNVARVAAACGAEVTATGLAGGRHGTLIREELAGEGIRPDFCPIAAESRQTITVIADGGGHPTEFRERGPDVAAPEWVRFTERYAELAAAARVVTLSGSLPPGLPANAYAVLTSIARRAGATVIVDAGGAVLRLACAAGPDIVKPNAAELRGATGLSATLGSASRLRALGADAVVVSLGRGGLVAVTPAGRWRVSHGELRGNPVGAGDALVAGLAVAADRGGYPWDEAGWQRALTEATSLAMASLLRPVAGHVAPADALRLAETISLSPIEG